MTAAQSLQAACLRAPSLDKQAAPMFFRIAAGASKAAPTVARTATKVVTQPSIPGAWTARPTVQAVANRTARTAATAAPAVSSALPAATTAVKAPSTLWSGAKRVGNFVKWPLMAQGAISGYTLPGQMRASGEMGAAEALANVRNLPWLDQLKFMFGSDGAVAKGINAKHPGLGNLVQNYSEGGMPSRYSQAFNAFLGRTS